MIYSILLIPSMSFSMVGVDRRASIDYDIEKVWSEQGFGILRVQGQKSVKFKVTCERVEGIDTITTYSDIGEVDNSLIKSSKLKEKVISLVCPYIENYADKNQFIMKLGYLTDYTSKEDKSRVCSLEFRAFNEREQKLLFNFCKE